MSEIDDAIRYFLEDVEDCENAIRGIKNTLKISEYEKEEIDALRTHADESRMLVEWLKELKQLREQLSSSENTLKQSFEGMTNGEVIKAVFNNDAFINFLLSYEDHYWWNAPYKGGEK